MSTCVSMVGIQVSEFDGACENMARYFAAIFFLMCRRWNTEELAVAPSLGAFGSAISSPSACRAVCREVDGTNENIAQSVRWSHGTAHTKV